MLNRLQIVGYYGLYLLPILVGVSFNTDYWYWLISGVCVATWTLLLWRGDRLDRILALAINCSTTLGNFILGTSLYVQGVGFNEQFFFHLNGETFRVAREVVPEMFFGSIAVWLLISLWPVLFWRHRSDVRVAVHGWLALGLLLHAPLISVTGYAYSKLNQAGEQTFVYRESSKEIEVDSTVEGRDLILVFAESMEAAYSDALIFGEDLTPNLTALASQGRSFSDIRQVSHTGWTMGGLVAAQCAVPMSTTAGANSVLANVSAPLPEEICLADILRAYGYQTAFMGGAQLSFAGKGNFLRNHGFYVVLGGDRLLALVDDPDYKNGWGMYDDTLFDLARTKIEQFSAKNNPFALVLLTLDTHHPSGFPSASCPETDNPDFRSVIRCSDQLISRFIEDVRRDHPDAVVVLFSDHLSHRNDVYDQLLEVENERRLRFFMLGRHLEPAVDHQPGTHFDLLPTMLEAIGIDGYTEHNLGVSLLSGQSGWFSIENPESMTLSGRALGVDFSLADTVSFSVRGPTIQIGDRRLLASLEGLSLKKGIYAVEFDDDGDLRRFRDNRNFQRFQDNLPAGFVLGISTNPEFNDHYSPGSNSKTIYFAGRFNSERFLAAPLWWEETIDITDLRR